MAALRRIRFRPAILVGMQASGTMPSMTVGQVSAQIQECMHPMDVPITSRRCRTPNRSVARRYSARTMSS